jgi:tagatose 1,6-diphosphate aldolase
VLLSAGVDFDTFKKQVEIACKAGASGFLAGRALWKEGGQICSREERMKFFRQTAASRLKELIKIVEKYGKPWYIKAGVKNNELLHVPEGWYRKY